MCPGVAQHESAAASGVGSVEAEKENTQAANSASTSLRGYMDTWILLQEHKGEVLTI